MYRSYYNLKLSPFRLEPDPAFLWLSPKHQEGLAALQYAILESRGFLLLSGDVGAGKTVLIHHLRNILPGRVRVAFIGDPGIEILDLYRILTAEFDMEGGFTGKADFLIRFKQILNQACGAQDEVLVIIDEAHRLSVEMLDEIRVLSGIDSQGRKLINIFLVGQEELQRLLADPRNHAIRQQLAVSYHLSPLNEDETREYIRHRLKVAGTEQELFSPAAVHEIYAFARGTPRLINAVCDRALLTGYLKEQMPVGPETVRECAAELDLYRSAPAPGAEPVPAETKTAEAAAEVPWEAISAPTPKRARPWLWAAVIGVLGVIGLLVFWTGLNRPGRPTVVPERRSGQPAPPAAAAILQKPSAADVPAVAAPPGPGRPDEAATGALPAPPPAAGDPMAGPTPAATPSAASRSFHIFFKPGSADLEERSFPVLSELAQLIAAEPVSRTTRLTHWDSADSALNARLLTLRANCVKSYLAGRGVDARLSVVGRSAENLPEDQRPPGHAGGDSWMEIRLEAGNGG
jgi:general secretion pathway protein A